MGDQGTLLISESEVNYAGLLYRDPERARLGRVDPEGLRHRAQAPGGEGAEASPARSRTCASRSSPDQHTVPVVLRDPYHQPHLQNFFDAVRGKAKLNCPAEVGYESAVSVLKVNEAIEAKSRLSFKPEEFHDAEDRERMERH